MERQGKIGVRLLRKFWQGKEPATAQGTKKYYAERSERRSRNEGLF